MMLLRALFSSAVVLASIIPSLAAPPSSAGSTPAIPSTACPTLTTFRLLPLTSPYWRVRNRDARKVPACDGCRTPRGLRGAFHRTRPNEGTHRGGMVRNDGSLSTSPIHRSPDCSVNLQSRHVRHLLRVQPPARLVESRLQMPTAQTWDI
jgi:hypothetical protein